MARTGSLTRTGPGDARAEGARSPDRARSATPGIPAAVLGAARQTPTVCVDLDSTLCDTRHRQHMIHAADDPVPTDWRAYSLACADDAPIEGSIALLRLLALSCRIVILSARDEAARGLTERWLRDHQVPYDRLILYRPQVDDADMGAFKAAQVERLRAEGAEVALMVEDALPVAASIRALGVATLLVRPPGADEDREASSSAAARPPDAA